jgi:hypothetical protein
LQNGTFGHVTDYIALVADMALAVLTFTGVYYAFMSSRLFRGDVMERVWRLATVAFLIIAFFSVFDFILTVENSPLVQLHLVRIAAAFGVGVFVVSLGTLVGWAKSSTEPRTQPSQQYLQR